MTCSGQHEIPCLFGCYLFEWETCEVLWLYLLHGLSVAPRWSLERFVAYAVKYLLKKMIEVKNEIKSPKLESSVCITTNFNQLFNVLLH